MPDHESFMREAIFEAKYTYDNLGRVGAVLVQDEKIIGRAGSSSVNKTHAEQNVLEKIGWLNDSKKYPGSIICVTYSPCLERSSKEKICCSDLIIKAGVEQVIYGAIDLKFGKSKTENYFYREGIMAKQIQDSELIEICKRIFWGSFIRPD